MAGTTGTKRASGPPSSKATAATIAAALATMFWTIAAHTFWKNLSTADLTLYISTSTVILTAFGGYLTSESAAFTHYNQQRLLDQQTANDSVTLSSAIESAIKAQISQVQAQQNPNLQQSNIAVDGGGPTGGGS